MYDSESVVTRHESLYKAFLYFYPESYQKRFGQEMVYAFRDLYQEEFVKYGKVGIGFWLTIFADTANGIITQHVDLMKKQGIKKYFHITSYNIVGLLLLLPFITLFSLDIIGRLIQGDVTRYNRAWYAAITQSVLYKEPIILQMVFIFGPILAVLLNIIPIVISLQKTKNPTFSKLMYGNPLAVILIGIGIVCLLIVYGHDFFPCIVHGLLRFDVGKLPYIISYCNNT